MNTMAIAGNFGCLKLQPEGLAGALIQDDVKNIQEAAARAGSTQSSPSH